MKIYTEIKTLFDKYEILNGYKIETSYFVKGSTIINKY